MNWYIILGLFVIAVSCGIYIVPFYAIMQHRSEAKYLSRVIAANNVMNAFFMVLASLVIIALVQFDLDLLQIFMLVGMSNILVFLSIQRIVKKRLG